MQGIQGDNKGKNTKSEPRIKKTSKANSKFVKKGGTKNSKNADELYSKLIGISTKNTTNDIDTNNLSETINKMKRSERLNRKPGNTSETNTESKNENPDWFLNTFLVRAKEILVLSFFIVGITFTVLIATGILG